VAAVAAGVGGYLGWQYLAKPKAKIRVVAIAHAAPGMKAVAEEDFMKAHPNIKVETLCLTGRLVGIGSSMSSQPEQVSMMLLSCGTAFIPVRSRPTATRLMS
jgi:hypothetical protein